MLSRRYFLKSSGLAMVSLGIEPDFFARIAQGEPQKKGRVLVTIFQRGAADGLNIVVPFAEKRYFDLRPTIAIPAPSSGEARGALDLDGFFAFHPALEPLLPLYKSRHLAIIHAAGSPDNTRSHFDAQDYMESATPGMKSTRDGWLNRYLLARPAADATPFRAVSMTVSMPRSLQGRAPAVAIGNIGEFDVRAGADSDQARNAFKGMYASTASGMLQNIGKETFEAVEFLKRTNPSQYQPGEGVNYPRSPLGLSLKQIAQLIKSEVGLEVAFAETGGWDHHANEGGVQGQLSQRLSDLANSLAAFYKDMEGYLDDILIVTMSEFGRTARENGNRGTDHGHANVMFVLGGPVKGGKVYGKWPGLAQDQLYEGRDLALTTDFRDVFAELLVQHLMLKNPAPVFPGYNLRRENFRGFLSALSR
jgi:uncharacterized protein (DUF1501 family)